VNVKLNVWLPESGPPLKRPVGEALRSRLSTDVTVWGALSLFVNTPVVPRCTARVFGEKANAAIRTCAAACWVTVVV
jgi:hypothetical protein